MNPAGGVFVSGRQSMFFKADNLANIFQTIMLQLTNTARDAAEFGQRVAQNKTHHGVVWIVPLEMRRQQLERLRAVKIIGINDSERFVNSVRRHQNRMSRSPRFLAIGWQD